MYRQFALISMLLICSFSITLFSNTPEIGKTANGIEYVKGELIIKLASHVDINNVDAVNRSSSPGSFFGIPSLDRTLQQNGGYATQKSFRNAEQVTFKRAAGNNKLIEQARSLERYYKVMIDQSIPIEKIIAGLKRDPNVELVEYSYVYEPYDVPNDALYNTLQHLPQIKAEEAWQIHKGENGPEVIIGIHDTGCQWDHPDLFANLHINYDEWTNQNEPLFVQQGSRLVINPLAVNGEDSDGNGYIDDVIGYNFYPYDTTPRNDPYGSTSNTHGTHVAGIAAGVTNNDVGIAAISYNVKFIATRHSALSGAQYLYAVDQGLWYMAAAGVDVVNMSWGGGGFSFMMAELFHYLDDIGVTLISSAGNSNRDEILYPNSYPKVMSIASVASSDARAYYSTYGIQVDVSSPGGDAYVDGGINSTYPLNTYRKLQGTSMAGPLVAGLAGLIKSYKPNWTPLQIRKQIAGTADDIYPVNPSLTGKLGAGRINAYRSLTETNVTVSTEPRLALLDVDYYNQDGSQSINPGDIVYIDALMRNFNMFHDAGALVFKPVSSNPLITPYGQNIVHYVKADDMTTVEGIALKVSDNAKPAIVEIDILVEKLDGTFLMQFPAQFNISGGVLVFEHIMQSQYQSGTFIKDELESKGFDVVYTNKMPGSFYGFDAVFMSFGNYSQSPIYQLSNSDFDKIGSYLQSGGKLYYDGSSLFAGQVVPNISNFDLQILFGISAANYGNPTNPAFGSVAGQANSAAEGMLFTGTNQPGTYLTERYTPSANYGGKAMLNEANYGTVGIQTAGLMGQRVVLMSFALGQLQDGDCPSTRSTLLDNIIDFMGLLRPIQINLPSHLSICKNGEVEIHPGLTYDCKTDSYLNKSVTGGSGNYNFSWTNSQYLENSNTANPTVANLPNNTTFKLTVTDQYFDHSAETITNVSVVQPPNVGIITLVRIKAGTYVNINNYITNYSSDNTYYWYVGNSSEPLDTEEAENWKVPTGMTYLYVVAANSHGCVSEHTRRVTVVGSFRKDNIDITESINGFASMISYPSVVNDYMNISAEFASETQYSVVVTDLLGNTVYIGENGYSNNYESVIDLTNLTSGAYMLIIKTDSDRLVKKFIKM
ncbi:MAG: S8 family serine peptidase [Candidatus Kapabacteria bacterium]|nr:S8 family serine peptidase [Ignavibacteriota bacterium]MCW5885955.1 S8 family serine peptidase [Candidatus Kapabacteria bacterium]